MKTYIVQFYILFFSAPKWHNHHIYGMKLTQDNKKDYKRW